MAIIKAPNRDYTGTSAGVTFIDGIGETYSPHLLEWFREHGYEVVEKETSRAAPDGGIKWAVEDAAQNWEPEEKPRPKRAARKRGGKK